MCDYWPVLRPQSHQQWLPRNPQVPNRQTGLPRPLPLHAVSGGTPQTMMAVFPARTEMDEAAALMFQTARIWG
jgi:hypothetical protein